MNRAPGPALGAPARPRRLSRAARGYAARPGGPPRLAVQPGAGPAGRGLAARDRPAGPPRSVSDHRGRGVNLLVDLGAGPRTLMLAAHHDAVPGSPGANDNAAAVGILRALGARLIADPPRRLRVRLAFFGGEERAMLGSRVYARRTGPGDLIGVVSLELCGIGDSLALWDVTPRSRGRRSSAASSRRVEALGYRRDETYHLATPVPFFASDHRPFADRGVPGVGLTAVPDRDGAPAGIHLRGRARHPDSARPPPAALHDLPHSPATLRRRSSSPTLAAVEQAPRGARADPRRRSGLSGAPGPLGRRRPGCFARGGGRLGLERLATDENLDRALLAHGEGIDGGRDVAAQEDLDGRAPPGGRGRRAPPPGRRPE